jgi:cytochrome c peroxidase
MLRDLVVGLRRLATFALSLPVAIGSVGCGGAGGETNAESSPRVGKAATIPYVIATDQTKPEPPAVSPVSKLDAKVLVASVKEDDGGSEESRENYLWLPPERSKVQDEPLTVEVPKGLQPLTAWIPASNPLTKGKIELGKQLYFDPRISLDATVSCATCHNPSKTWTDLMATSTGIDGQNGARSAPTVLNTVYGKSMFWDGRAASLEAQSLGPPRNPIEMGKQTYKEIIDRLRSISGYRAQFEKVFGTDVTLDGVAKAIAAFERATALSGNSAYDKYNAGDLSALTASQKRGMVLFGLRLSPDDEFDPKVTLQKAKCTLCHVGFNFTDEQFHNLGIGWNDKDGTFADRGRFDIDAVGAKSMQSLGAFKTPTVREVERTAPYMHDGSLKTLEEVVEHYDKGGNPNPALDKDMVKLNLTSQEKADLVAFMKALNGDLPKVDLPTLPPGPDGKSLNAADSVVPPTRKTASNAVVHPRAVR